MYSIFSNEKLGMAVEEVRLQEIRQQIEAQRLGDGVKPRQSYRRIAFGSPSLKVLHPLRGFTPILSILLWAVRIRNGG